MRGSVFYLVFAAGIALTACQTTQTVSDDDDPAVGIRREPCGGGPVFPPEEEAPDDKGPTPDNE